MANRDHKRRRAFRSRPVTTQYPRDTLDILASFSQILEIVDFEAVQQLIVERARAIFASDAAALLLPNDEGTFLVPRATVGFSPAYGAQRVPLDHPSTLSERICASDDLGVQTRDNGALVRSEGMRSALSATLIAQDAYVGTLTVYMRRRHTFSASDHALMDALARCAAQAIANARRHASEHLIKRDLEEAYSELLTTLTELERAQQRLLRTERTRTLGELAGNIAHDFNNLLMGILGNAQMLLADANEPQRQLLQVIEQAALDGRAMVRRLQEYTNRPGAAPEHTLIDLTSVIDGALAITRPRWLALSRGGATIGVRREVRGPLLVIGNAPELREVLINLLVNALDAMPNGGTISVRALPSANTLTPSVVIEVADSGVGIAPSLQAEIFEPFFTTKRAEDGSGLGLAICKSIITHHGGTIEVESAVGSGACFRITLPEAN